MHRGPAGRPTTTSHPDGVEGKDEVPSRPRLQAELSELKIRLRTER